MLSSCEKCWETLCRCGHSYKHWSAKDLEDLIAVLQNVLVSKLGSDRKTPDQDQNIAES